MVSLYSFHEYNTKFDNLILNKYLGWMAIWYRFGTPSVSLFVLLNSLVHVLMYSYYALASFGQSIQPYLWWKIYLTQIQLLQFVLLFCYGCFVIKYEQNYPSIAYILAISQPPLFFILFLNFYFNAYTNSFSFFNMSKHFPKIIKQS